MSNNTSVDIDDHSTIPSSSPSSPIIPDWEYLLGYSLVCSETFLHILLLPIIAINYCVLIQTSIIHRNLKFILICQNSYILLFTLSRISYISLKFAFGSPFWSGMPFLKAPMFFSFLFGNWIGHFLLIERLMATFFVKKYEKSRNAWFSIVWFTFLFAISVQDTYSQIIQNANIHDISVWTLVHFTAILFCSFVEIIICSILAIYNEKIYKEKLFLPVHSLSERYQMWENVKTAKQLRPAFFFHFLNILLSSGITYLMAFNAIHGGADKLEMALMVFYFGTTCSNLGIVVTIVSHHPTFRRKVKLLICRLNFCQKGSIGDSQSNQSFEASAVAHLSELAMDKRVKTEEYFKTLNQYWAKDQQEKRGTK